MMSIEILDYEDAYSWVDEAHATANPHLLLGNGFSVAFDRDRFSYVALLEYARERGRLGSTAEKFFTQFGTCDFEVVIRKLMDVATALETLDSSRYAEEVKNLRQESDNLKELLATTLADLHPERPNIIPEASYGRVATFVNRHKKVFTANYDLLLYWTLMQSGGGTGFGRSDDGFRDLEQGA